jgi:hypothetical protein
MSFTGKTLCFLGLASLAISVASAQSLPPSVVACTAEKDSLARLVCFDREVAKFTQSAAAVAPKPATPAAPPPPAPAVAATRPPVAAPDPDKFGMSGEIARKRAEANQEPDPTPKELRAAVANISAKPYGELILALDNGQVWEQNESNNAFMIKVGEKIVIKEGRLGSYMLTTDRGATTRVHRTH